MELGMQTGWSGNRALNDAGYAGRATADESMRPEIR
jgi:hypothetical protein